MYVHAAFLIKLLDCKKLDQLACAISLGIRDGIRQAKIFELLYTGIGMHAGGMGN